MRSIDPISPERRWLVAVPFIVIGTISIISAGFAAAVTAFAPSYLASWAVAFLVLVLGVAQVVLGIGQALLAPQVPSRAVLGSEVLLYNAGSVGVLLGQLLALPVLTVLGSLLLVVSLGLLFHVAWGAAGARNKLLLFAFRAMLLILLVSIPVGLLLARNSR